MKIPRRPAWQLRAFIGLSAALATIALASTPAGAASVAPPSADAPAAPPATGSTAQPVSALAADGQATRLPRAARRIISLAPHLTELLFAAGAGQRVVGVSAWSDWPAAARQIVRIGDSQAIDLERILALRPDLVIAWAGASPQRQLAQLRRLGISVHLEDASQLDDIAAAIERLGTLAGTPATARAAARDYRQRLAALRARHAGQARVRVFHQVWADPLMTVNGKHPISQLIQACGGENVFADAAQLVPVISREAVLRARPAVITATDDEVDPFAGWRRWTSLPAVAGDQLVALPADLISRPSPRLLDAAPALCAAIDAARIASAPAPAP